MAFEAARQKFGMLVEAYSGKSVDELIAITKGKELALFLQLKLPFSKRRRRKSGICQKKKYLYLPLVLSNVR
jgi:hypothetical protein